MRRPKLSGRLRRAILRSLMPRPRLGFTAAIAGILLVSSGAFAGPPAGAPGERMELKRDWELKSSCEAKAGGEQVSAVGFDASKWHRTHLPNTVVGALVDDKTYADPTYGTNL